MKLDELATFPQGAHDDQVDSTTQALNHLRGRFSWAGLYAYIEQQAAEYTSEPLPALESHAPFEPSRPATFRDLLYRLGAIRPPAATKRAPKKK